MDIPGENLSKVHHYYVDPHPYFEMDVAVIGGKNSAAIAALELWRSGARVTLIYRGPGVTPNVKYWIKPDIENRIKDGEIKAFFDTNVVEITPDTIVLETPEGPRHHPQRLRLRHDRLSSRLHLPRAAGHPLSTAPTSCRSAIRRRWKATSRASTWPASSWPARAPTKFLLRMAASTAARLPPRLHPTLKAGAGI